jgi:hypothetical protein
MSVPDTASDPFAVPKHPAQVPPVVQFVTFSVVWRPES